MVYSELTYRIAFSSLKGNNRLLATEMLGRVGSERNFFTLPERQLSSVLGFRNRIVTDAYRNELLEKSAKEANFVEAHKISALYFKDEDYPQRLECCDDAPLMIFGKGDADLNSARMLGIVGTRHATIYGVEFVDRLVRDLSEKLAEKVVIVSGLAFGVDIAAHKAALRYGLPTVAVLAHGLNMIYPAQHRNIAADIAKRGGMLITDYMTSDVIHKGFFLARNRIVAGICDCLLVVESGRKGGAMVTANIASGYGRDVFAVPGRVSDVYSIGCNKLINQNIAHLVTDADDIVDAMGWPLKPQEGKQGEIFPEYTPEEQAVIDYLTSNPDKQINSMAVALNRNIAMLLALLIEMEFKGYIIKVPGGIYRLAQH